jgi:hypothetical protein
MENNLGENTVAEALNKSEFSIFHIKAMFASAMGVFYFGLRFVYYWYGFDFNQV